MNHAIIPGCNLVETNLCTSLGSGVILGKESPRSGRSYPQRQRRPLLSPAFPACHDPAASRICFGRASLYDGTGTVNQQHAELWIASLADTQKSLLMAGGMLAWTSPNQGDSCRRLRNALRSPSLPLSRSSHPADCFHACDPLTGFVS